MTPSSLLQQQQKEFEGSMISPDVITGYHALLISCLEEWAKEHRLTERSKIDATYNEKTAYNEALDDLLEFLKS